MASDIRPFLAPDQPFLQRWVEKPSSCFSGQRRLLPYGWKQSNWRGGTHANDPIYSVIEFLAFDEAIKLQLTLLKRMGIPLSWPSRIITQAAWLLAINRIQSTRLHKGRRSYWASSKAGNTVKSLTAARISIRDIYVSGGKLQISNSVKYNFRKSLGQPFSQEFFQFLFQVFNSFFNSVSLANYISFGADWDIEIFFLTDGCRKRKTDLHTLKYPLVYFKDFGYVEIL